MKVKIVTDDKVTIYQGDDKNSSVVEQLSDGDVVEIERAKGLLHPHTKATLPSGQCGYILGEFRYHTLQKCVSKEGVIVHESASDESPVKATYKSEDEFYYSDAIQQDGKHWVRVHDMSGQQLGFMPGETQIKDIDRARVGFRRLGEAIGTGAFGGVLAGLIAYYGSGQLRFAVLLVWLFVMMGVKGVMRKILASIVFGVIAALVIALWKL